MAVSGEMPTFAAVMINPQVPEGRYTLMMIRLHYHQNSGRCDYHKQLMERLGLPAYVVKDTKSWYLEIREDDFYLWHHYVRGCEL